MYWREKLYDICGNFEIYTENLEYYEYEKGKLEWVAQTKKKNKKF